MASENQIRDLIIEPMLALYVQPRGVNNPQLALQQYLQALKPYEAAALEGAWIAVRNNREVSTWPTIGEIVKSVRDWIHNNIKTEEGAAAKADKETKRFPQNAERAMQTNMGQRALQEGWGRILYQYVYQHGSEEGFIAARAVETDRMVRKSVTDLEASDHWLKDKLIKLGRTMLAREDDLRARFLRRAA